MLAAWNVSPLTTKIVIVFGVLVLWVLIIEMIDQLELNLKILAMNLVIFLFQENKCLL